MSRYKYIFKPITEHFHSDKSTAILLTMYSGGNEERTIMYKKNITLWLNHTPFDIFTVNSSGHSLGMTHPRLHEFYFQQDFPQAISNPSQAEKNSILRALEHFPELYSYSLLFKVTAKYYCPNFMEEYNLIPDTSEIILQHTHSTENKVQHTEIVGMKPSRYKDCLEAITETFIFEYALYQYQAQYLDKVYRMGHLSIHTKCPRSDGSIMLELYTDQIFL